MIIEFKKSLRNKFRKNPFLLVDENVFRRVPKRIADYIDFGQIIGLIWNSFSRATYDDSFNHYRLQI